MQYQEKVKNAEAEAEEIIKTAKRKARTEAEKIIDNGRASAETIMVNAHKHMEAERHIMVTRFNLEAVAIVMAASAKLVQRDLSGEDNRRYAALLLDELAAQKGNV
jgi:F0F1-type ATP synthase membrane subunit b/b'